MISRLSITAFALVIALPLGPAVADASFVPAVAPSFVTLKSAARIDAPRVILGDVFDNAGEHASDEVAASPAPGTAVVFTTSWLTNVAASHGLRWEPPSAYASIRVERAALTIESDQIEAALGRALNLGGPEQRVVLDSPLHLYAPTDAAPDVGIEHLSLNQITNHFVAEIRVPANDPAVAPVHVSGAVRKFVQLPTLTRAVMPGDVIHEADVELVWQRAELNPSSGTPLAGDLVGKTPRHPLRANQPVRLADIETPVLVKRSDIVLIVLESPSMVLTAEGKALEDGGLGDTIRVSNVQSNRIVDATVLASGRVSVRAPMTLAAVY